jgi:pimeloyl-ACP methyl ester carboxylesterase
MCAALVSASTAQAERKNAARSEHVVLLHGLCRTPRSMSRLENELANAGYAVHNLGYPSRRMSISALAEEYVGKAVERCQREGAGTIHLIGHSMGAILVREYLSRHALANLGKVIMLGPPNQGSEVVDRLGKNFLFRAINGPAGAEMGTAGDSLPNRLGAVTYPVGIIAGDRTINWINSFAMIPGKDDGKVSVERTKLTGMADHIVLHTAHPFIMRNREAIAQVLSFLRTGRFQR